MGAMHKSVFLVLILALAAVVPALSFGCGNSKNPWSFDDGRGDAGDDATTDDTGCSFAGCDAAQDTIVISPQNVVLSIVWGQPPVPTQTFTATLNGNDVTATVQWSYDRADIGGVQSGSTFTPTGNVGGVGMLTATIGKSSGTTTVGVTIKKTINGGVSGTQQSSLDNPQGGPDSATLVYPYNDTVFPLGVLSPQMQWNGAQASDVLKLELKEKYYDYVEYLQNGPLPANHLMSETDWTAFESSGTGPTSDPVHVYLTRMSGNTAYTPMTQTWHIAQGRLHGAIYYWELPDACGNGSSVNGRILRIKPDATQVDQFYQTGTCFGCHTVSRDGTTMMSAFPSSVSSFPLQTIDLTKTPAVLGKIQGNQLGGTFSAFNDKGDKILVSNNAEFTNGAGLSMLNIVDANTGSVLVNGALPAGCGEPAWSPDGKHLAGVCAMSGSGNFTWDSPYGNLTLADVAPDGTTVSNIQTIVPQGSPGRPAYPSFSPDSAYIAFGRPTTGARSIGNGDLWLTDLKGQAVKNLKIASSDDKSYNPVFSPLRAGGYSWIVFMSKRDYGNQLTGADRQQLWIAAIDDPPSATDPSHPPFYVRGQQMCAKSENAYYALPPCKTTGDTCTSGVDCCGGQCIKNPNGPGYICGSQQGCSQDGNSCKADSDCCDDRAHCIDGYCQLTPPQ
jgi:hypothetical protein